MKQFSFVVHDADEVKGAVASAKKAAGTMASTSSVLISLLMKRLDERLVGETREAVQQTFPDAGFFGSAAEAAAAGDRVCLFEEEEAGAAVLMIMLFEGSRAEICLPLAEGRSPKEAGRALAERIDATKDIRAVALFITDFGVDFPSFSKGLEATQKNPIFFGGFTGGEWSGDARVAFAGEEFISHGILAVLFSGAELRMSITSSFGWKPLGIPLLVTKTEGNKVVSLNQRPALEVFSRYLGIDKDWESYQDLLPFPVSFYRHGVQIARHVREFLPDGSVVFSSDIQEGEELYLSYGDPSSVIMEASKSQRALRAFRPEGALVISCLTRQMLLAEAISSELTTLASFVPVTGLYTYGELRESEHALVVTNMTLVALVMREGEADLSASLPPVNEALPRFTKQTSIIHYLVHFIQAMTEEWTEAYSQLVSYVELDGLTGLLSRRAMDMVLRKQLRASSLSHEVFAVLMMDLDDFKSINDNYGHAVGDEALKAFSAVLKNSTREGKDFVSRWGGDEFFVVLMSDDEKTIAQIVERVQERTKEIDLLPYGKRFTTSIGVVTARADDTAESIFRRVDQALYAAKNQPGKGTVAFG
ncbi:hypothetical protein TAMA11512_05860 [Selenomonas sp. TAMA-11512]|uniref:sensor domain-containing diguanylate cyclase n=1 Tax=Selenomonas sp. TAMA-11512 TaxID=3095337 RepID=UPI003091E0C4|nr:hypothetical protein TAMA11512_05860 [Selenomonas sp. TAMA-11512]